METAPAIRFAHAARVLGAAARAGGLAVPAFRSPPRVAGTARTIRRYPGGAVIAVQIRGRGFDEIVSDMIEGVIAANRLDGDAAQRVRSMLRSSLGDGEAGAGARPVAA